MKDNHTISIRTPESESSTDIVVRCSSSEEATSGKRKQSGNPIPSNLNPTYLMQELNKVVIGQEEAKRKAVAAVMTHVLRTVLITNGHEDSINKNNLLLMGPTGCGKTLILDTLSKAAQLPLVKIDASKLSVPGYVGESFKSALESRLESVLKQWGKTVTEFGIVFVDEIDKLHRNGNEGGFASRIQSSMLATIEGVTLDIDVGGKRTQEVNTRNMLFVFAGNFESVRAARGTVKRGIGFNLNTDTSKTGAGSDIDITEELIKAGIIAELVGRMSTVGELQQLTKEDYKRVLTESSISPCKQFQTYAEMLGTGKVLKSEDLDNIVEKAIKGKTGIRGLNALVAQAYEDIILNGDYSRVRVDADLGGT